MHLFIDRGNTATKWQVVEGSSLLMEGVGNNSDSIAAIFKAVEKECLSAIFVSSVGSNEFQNALKKWAEKRGYPVPSFIESSSKACGVTNIYSKPKTLGVDRWLAIIAAHNKYEGLLCVVDSGTAMTMDFVMDNGEHLGGYIVPGSKLQQQSLLLNTEKIHVSDVMVKGCLGVNTAEAVVFGIEQMLLAFIEAKIVEISKKHKQKVTLVLTGGHADQLAEGLVSPVNLEKDLVLQGLNVMVKQAK